MKKIREENVISLYQYDLLGKIYEPNDDVNKIIESLDEIDDIISDNLFNYTLERLSYIDRAIIRHATYELKYTDLASAIIIDASIELTKQFSDLDDERQHKFNNKLIDNINKSLRG